MRTFSSGDSHKVLTTQHVSQSQPGLSVSRPYLMSIEYFLLGFLVSLAVGALSYRQYRAWIFRRRVEVLERLWNLSTQKKAL